MISHIKNKGEKNEKHLHKRRDLQIPTRKI